MLPIPQTSSDVCATSRSSPRHRAFIWELKCPTLSPEFPECSHFNALLEQEGINIDARPERRAVSKMEVWSAACLIALWRSNGDVAISVRVTH
jgi:hypothetical protein